MVSYHFKPESPWISSLWFETESMNVMPCININVNLTKTNTVIMQMFVTIIMQFLSTWMLVTATSIPHFTLSVQYNGWLQQLCPIGNIDTMAYHGVNHVPWRPSGIVVQKIYCILADHLIMFLDSVWNLVQVNVNCFHLWFDYIIGSFLVVYHLCIFEHVLSVATLNLD